MGTKRQRPRWALTLVTSFSGLLAACPLAMKCSRCSWTAFSPILLTKRHARHMIDIWERDKQPSASVTLFCESAQARSPLRERGPVPLLDKNGPGLTSKTLLSISPHTLGPFVRRNFDCAKTGPAKLPVTQVTESRRAARRGIKRNEAYLSAVQTRPQTASRFSRAHGHQGRPRRRRSPAQPWPQASVRLRKGAIVAVNRQGRAGRPAAASQAPRISGRPAW